MSTATQSYIDSKYVPPQNGNDGENGGQGRLYAYQGKSYFATNTASDRQPLKDWFTAAAIAVGENSSAVEFPTAGIAYVGHPANAQANQGFIRDRGAVLALIALTDEPDKSMEPLATYHALIAGTKGGCGGDACIITAGIIDPCLTTTNNILWQFLNDFGEQTMWTSIDGTVADYTQIVGSALARFVSQTCMVIKGPG